jgi:predicted Zn finger-like uncharacterized protein
MPILVSCPQCRGQLRVSDDLIGRKVRCPACQTVLEAAAPAAPAPAQTPIEQVRVEPWQQLDLELASDPPESQRSGGRRPVGAREVDSGPQEPPRRPARERDDEEDDLTPCPRCRKLVHADSRRCYACGARLNGETRNEFELPGTPVRRDCEPHRGTTVLVMGVMSLIAMWIGCGPIGIVLGAIGWWMGQGDMKKIRTGAMDPDGKGTTQAGWICSIIGTLLSLLMTLACAGFIGMLWYDSMQRSNNMTRPTFTPPPPKMQPMQPVPNRPRVPGQMQPKDKI